MTVYFPDQQGLSLVPETRGVLVYSHDPVSLSTAVIHELIAGPAHDTQPDVLPGNTRINNITIEDHLVTVDFGPEILINHSRGPSGESMTVYGIVNSLTQLGSIDQVQILIDGSKVEILAGSLDIKEPLVFNPSVVEQPSQV